MTKVSGGKVGSKQHQLAQMRERRATLILWNQKILFYTQIALFHGNLATTLENCSLLTSILKIEEDGIQIQCC